MADKIKIEDFNQIVQRQPAMFLCSNNSNGIINLLCGLIWDCIFICNTDKLFFCIDISSDNKLSLQIKSDIDISIFIKQLSDEQWRKQGFHLKILKAVTDYLEILDNITTLTLNFHIDTKIFTDITIDFQKLSEELLLIASRNQQCEILLKDTTQKYLIQNYFNFPNGIIYLYERIIRRDVLVKPEMELFYDNQVKGNKYQIALACRTDIYPAPIILSFANEINTIDGGTLVDGIIDGLISASKNYVTDNKLISCKIKRKKLYKGLIIVCSVIGDNFEFNGSIKQSLATKEVRTQAKKIIYKLVSDYLNSSKDKAEKLLCRFSILN